MNIDLKYRFPRYKALPKGWSFNHDGYYSHRWENWKVNEVEGSYVTNYTYKTCTFKDKDDAKKYEEDARRHYIVCEDGCADWSMPILYKQVEIDPDTLRQDTGIEYRFKWSNPRGVEKEYTATLWEHDIVEFESVIQACKPSLKGIGEIVWNNNRWEIKPIIFHKDIDAGFDEETVVKNNVNLGFKAYDFLNNHIIKVYGTMFAWKHHKDIWMKNPEKDPFKDIRL